MDDDDPVERDPDVRFSFANERTFLAWNRTALALIATGVAASQLLPKFHVTEGRRILARPLVILGAWVAAASLGHWRANERALRRGRSPPPLPHAAHPGRGCGDHRRHRCGTGRLRGRLGVHDTREGGPKTRGRARRRGPGPERTDLAWNRTGLAVVVCIAVLLRRLRPLRGADQVVALAGISAGAMAWAVVLWMGRPCRDGSARARRPPTHGS